MTDPVTITLNYRGLTRSYTMEREVALKAAPMMGDKIVSEIAELDAWFERQKPAFTSGHQDTITRDADGRVERIVRTVGYAYCVPRKDGDA